eukprot:PhM_4_TR15136/c0_g1_i1/m.74692
MIRQQNTIWRLCVRRKIGSGGGGWLCELRNVEGTGASRLALTARRRRARIIIIIIVIVSGRRVIIIRGSGQQERVQSWDRQPHREHRPGVHVAAREHRGPEGTALARCAVRLRLDAFVVKHKREVHSAGIRQRTDIDELLGRRRSVINNHSWDNGLGGPRRLAPARAQVIRVRGGGCGQGGDDRRQRCLDQFNGPEHIARNVEQGLVAQLHPLAVAEAPNVHKRLHAVVKHAHVAHNGAECQFRERHHRQGAVVLVHAEGNSTPLVFLLLLYLRRLALLLHLLHNLCERIRNQNDRKAEDKNTCDDRRTGNHFAPGSNGDRVPIANCRERHDRPPEGVENTLKR